MLKRFKKWLENYWYHYSTITWIVLFFVVSFFVLAGDYLKKKDPDLVVVYVGSVYGNASQFDSVKDRFSEMVGDLNQDGRVSVNYRMITIRKGHFTNYDVQKTQEMNYSFLDKSAQLYLIEDTFANEKTVYFEPLTDLLPPEALEGGLTNENGEVVAVPLAGKKIAKEMDFDRENTYIAVKTTMDIERNNAFSAAGKEKARELLQYIISG